jgi:aflatoxin B1 aldehyde reductase
MAPGPVKIVMGAAGFGNRDPYTKEEDIKEFFATLKAHGIDTIDTAQLYGKSEEKLGEANAGADFILDTKWAGGFGPEGSVEELIIKKGKESIEKLKVKQVSLVPLCLFRANVS